MCQCCGQKRASLPHCTSLIALLHLGLIEGGMCYWENCISWYLRVSFSKLHICICCLSNFTEKKMPNIWWFQLLRHQDYFRLSVEKVLTPGSAVKPHVAKEPGDGLIFEMYQSRIRVNIWAKWIWRYGAGVLFEEDKQIAMFYICSLLLYKELVGGPEFHLCFWKNKTLDILTFVYGHFCQTS